MPRNLSFTKRQAGYLAITVSGVLAVTVSVGAGAAFAFCAYVVLTA